MTSDESIEYQVIYDTRIGILCGSGPVTRSAHALAEKESKEHMENLRFEESLKRFTAHDSRAN